MAQGQGNKGGQAAKKAAAAKQAEKDTARDHASAPGTDAPEPHEAENQTSGEGSDEATGVADSGDVESQREEEQQAQTDAATDRDEPGKADLAAGEAERKQAEADAEARAGITESEDDEEEGATRGPFEPDEGDDNDPVAKQRREEAEAREEKRAEVTQQREEDAALLGAAPGGQRTAMTDGKEGSTVVKHTAAQSRPPLSGPLSPPVTDVENLAAREDDPDNRVYADEAGPRDVFEDTEGAKARYVDADGNALSYEEMFDDEQGKTFVTAKVRCFEVFRFPNSVVDGRRLAYAAGRRVPRGEAENVRNQISVHSPIV